jgi:hypothetical protein
MELFYLKEFIVEANSWLDEMEGKTYQIKIWRSVAIMTSITTVILGISTFPLVLKIRQDFKNERLILVPGIQRTLVIPAESYISNSFVKAVATRIVELQEQWSYETIEDHYSELFDSYYSHGLAELTRSNLISSDRFDYVKKNNIISTFKFDLSRSEFSWCKKLKRACALIVGTRRVYINNNEPYSQKEVTYLLLAESIWPTEFHPHALKFKRVKIDDSSENTYENIKKQFDAAKQGVMPNEA